MTDVIEYYMSEKKYPYRKYLVVENWEGGFVFQIEPFEPYVYWPYGGEA